MAHADDDHRHVDTRSSSVPCSTASQKRLVDGARRERAPGAAVAAGEVAAAERAEQLQRAPRSGCRSAAAIASRMRAAAPGTPPALTPTTRWPARCVAIVGERPRLRRIGDVDQAVQARARRRRPPRSSRGRSSRRRRVRRRRCRRASYARSSSATRPASRQRAHLRASPRARRRAHARPTPRACSPCAPRPARRRRRARRSALPSTSSGTPLTGTALRRSTPRRGTRRTARRRPRSETLE